MLLNKFRNKYEVNLLNERELDSVIRAEITRIINEVPTLSEKDLKTLISYEAQKAYKSGKTLGEYAASKKISLPQKTISAKEPSVEAAPLGKHTAALLESGYTAANREALVKETYNPSSSLIEKIKKAHSEKSIGSNQKPPG